jgi:uncharacterized delta-60 repeat protein
MSKLELILRNRTPRLYNGRCSLTKTSSVINRLFDGRSARAIRLFFTGAAAILLLSMNLPLSTGQEITPAAAGDLDTAFGVGGKLTVDISPNDCITSLAFQPDGKLVAAGYFLDLLTGIDFGVGRFNPNGTPDTSFGVDGLARVDISGANDYADDAAIQPDGKIVLVGGTFIGSESHNNANFALARFKPGGGIDKSFGGAQGVQTDFFGGTDRAFSVAVQDDKILAVGAAYSGIQARSYDFGLARYNSDGTLDQAFGAAGKVATDFNNSNDQAHAVALQPDGKIVVAGLTSLNGGDFAMARYNADGSLDTSFGTGGKLNTDFNGRVDYAYGLSLQPDRKIIAVGWAYNSTSTQTDFALARYSPSGELDPKFGTNGKLTTDFFGRNEFAKDVLVLSDGRFIVGGYTLTGSEWSASDFALACYNQDGSLNSSFGIGGKVTTDFWGYEDVPYGMALSDTGRIVVAGYCGTGSGNWDASMACYLTGLEPDFDLSFDPLAVTGVRGTKVKVTVNIDRYYGFTDAVTVTPPDLSEEGLVPKFPDPITTNGPTASWKYKIKAWAATGPHQLTFRATDGTGRVRLATVTVNVE